MKPLRKIYYNMTITFVSVLVALLVGGVEILSVVANRLQLTGGGWHAILGSLSGQFGTIGIFIVVIFVACWAISTFIYKIKRYDEIEVSS